MGELQLHQVFSLSSIRVQLDIMEVQLLFGGSRAIVTLWIALVDSSRGQAIVSVVYR